MKKICLLMIILSVLTLCCGADYGELDSITENERGFSFSGTVSDILSGKEALSVKSLWDSVKEEFTKEVGNAVKSLFSVLGVIFLYSLVSAMQHGFGAGAAQLSFFALYSVVCTLLLKSFSETAAVCTELIDNLVLFANAAVPVIGTTVAAGGNFAIYSAMQPVLVMTATLSANIIKSVGVPALMLSLSLGVIGNLSESFSLSNISKTIRNCALWMITGLLTLFSAAVAICGMGAGGVNGVVMRGAKFVARSAIPVLGGLLSDSLDAVITGGMMLKNALGGAAVAAAVIMMVYPLIKTGAVILVYKVAAALVSPFCDRRISNVIEDISGVLSCLIGFAAAEGVTVIISFTTLINATNMGVMLR